MDYFLHWLWLLLPSSHSEGHFQSYIIFKFLQLTLVNWHNLKNSLPSSYSEALQIIQGMDDAIWQSKTLVNWHNLQKCLPSSYSPRNGCYLTVRLTFIFTYPLYLYLLLFTNCSLFLWPCPSSPPPLSLAYPPSLLFTKKLAPWLL